MSVFKLKDKPRNRPWCCEWRENGKVRRQFCETRALAIQFEAANNSKRWQTGLSLPSTIEDINKYTASEIILSYIGGRPVKFEYEIDKDDLIEESELPENDALVLHSVASRRIFSRKLFEFNEQVAEAYIEDRIGEPYYVNGSNKPKPTSPKTVERERVKLGNVWRWARRLPGLDQLENPWKDIKVEGGSAGNGRQRGLKKGELERLIDHCRGCLQPNRFYVPLAIYLAVGTGMRRQELVSLTWEDIDFANRRIKIGKSKTDRRTGRKGRLIVLPSITGTALMCLKLALADGGRIDSLDGTFFNPVVLPGNRIFPWKTGDALSDAFDKVVVRAGIKDLHFHDLRAAANMMFRRALLSDKEIEVMKNGVNDAYDVLEIYLELIQDKLDRYQWKGKTQEEAFTEVKEERLALILEGIEAGLNKEEAVKKAMAVEQAQLRNALDAIKTNPPS
jgi:integrase